MNVFVKKTTVSTMSAISAEKVSLWTGEMKMRIKKDFLICFLSTIAVLCFVFRSLAFADFNKVNECELARTNASVTGHLATTRCSSIPEGEVPDFKAKCVAERCSLILDEGALDTDVHSLSSVHDDYGYDWWKNWKVVNDLYYYVYPAALSPITVEAGRDGDTSWAWIGLGSQEVVLDSWDTLVTLNSEGAAWCGSQNVFCSIHLDGVIVKTNGSSYVKMYKADSRTGIGVDLDVTIDRISLATLSLGDCDGFTGARHAGYVGLKNTNITEVTASGNVAIDLVKNDIVGFKSVHIGIDKLNVGMSSLDTTVVLGDNKYFSGTRYFLGTLYMKDLKMNAVGYLDIYNPNDNHSATTLGFGLNVSSLTLDTLAWGDDDGFRGASKAGYVGLRNLTIGNLAIAGPIKMGMETAQVGDTDLPVGKPFFRMGFNKLKVSMAYFSADLALGDRKDNLNQSLGIVSISNLNVDMTGTVKITTH